MCLHAFVLFAEGERLNGFCEKPFLVCLEILLELMNLFLSGFSLSILLDRINFILFSSKLSLFHLKVAVQFFSTRE